MRISLFPHLLGTCFSFASGLIAQDPVAQEPVEMIRLDGAGFSVEHRADWEALESSNGSAYFVELRESVRGGDSAAVVRFILVPALQMTPDALVQGLVSEMAAFMQTIGRTQVNEVEEGQPTRMLCGAERTGLAVEWRTAANGSNLRSLVFTFEHGDWVAGVITMAGKTIPTDRERVHAILDSAAIKPFDTTSRRRVELTGCSFTVPAMTPMERRVVDGLTTLRFGLDKGHIEAAWVPVQGEDTALTLANSLLDHQVQSLASQARASGGSLEGARSIARWVNGIAPGRTYRLKSPERDLEVRAYSIPGDTFAVHLTCVIGDQAFRPTLLKELEGIFSSLEVSGRAIRSASQEGFGFAFDFDPEFLAVPVERESGQRIELRPDFSGARFWLEVSNTVTPSDYVEALPELVRQAAQEFDGAAEIGDSAPVSGMLLGASTSQALKAKSGGVDYEVYLFGAPLGNKVILAGMITRADDAADNLWTFASLTDTVRAVPPGQRSFETSAYTIRYDPALWRMKAWPIMGTRHTTLVLEGESGTATFLTRTDRANLKYVGLGGETLDADPVAHLEFVADLNSQTDRASDEGAGFQLSNVVKLTQRIGETFAVGRSYTRSLEDQPDQTALEWIGHYAFATETEVTEIELRSRDGDPEAILALVSLLSSIQPTSVLEHEAMQNVLDTLLPFEESSEEK